MILAMKVVYKREIVKITNLAKLERYYKDQQFSTRICKNRYFECFVKNATLPNKTGLWKPNVKTNRMGMDLSLRTQICHKLLNFFKLRCLFSVSIFKEEILDETTLKLGTEIGLKLPYIYLKRYIDDFYH